MARRTNKTNIHEFTQQIHSSRRVGTEFAKMNNHNEKLAKQNKDVVCRDCKFFNLGCKEYIGEYHKTCNEFEWW
jgi:hypothetical protein